MYRNESEEEELLTADRVARERSALMRDINYDLEVLTLYQLKQVKSYLVTRYHI